MQKLDNPIHRRRMTQESTSEFTHRDHGHDLHHHSSKIANESPRKGSQTSHSNPNDHDHKHAHDEDIHTCSDPSHNHIHEPSTSSGSAHDHGHSHHSNHGHTHEHLSSPGNYATREPPRKRKYNKRAFCVGIGGPVGSGKTALMLALCQKLKHNFNICAVTNDIFTKEDGEFLLRHDALPKDRIVAVETGGCPHAAIREDITANLIACEDLTAKHDCDIIILESGGDNLAADFSRELADFTIYVIDTAGGDKIPRKGGPGITQSDLLVINKTDLCEAVGASVEVMERDSKIMRKDGPFLFAQVKHGKGVDEIVRYIEYAYNKAKE